MNDIHINSFKSVQIEALTQETKASLGFATGFICKFKNRFFLVSNWHVFSGRNYESKEIIHPSGAVPGYFNLTIHLGKNKTDSTLEPMICNMSNMLLQTYEIQDNEIVISDTPFWSEHPIKGSDIDVAAIEITSIIPKEEDLTTIAYEIEKENEKAIHFNVMDDVFIIGYPLKSSTTPNSYPIYKAATIASEPNNYKDAPMFYIDGKTKKGMSGSPVIKRENFKVKQSVAGIQFTDGIVNLIGIYSGRERLAKDEYEAELGIVWRLKECIIPTLEQAIKEDKHNEVAKKALIELLSEKKKPTANTE